MLLVSAYINIESLESGKREQTFDIYKERGQKLINIPIKKIIFIDSRYIDYFTSNIYTKLIATRFEDLDIYKYYNYIRTNNDITILSPNSNKDTTLFHLIQIAKTEFVKKAIELESNEYSIYAWVDFGISKIFKNDDEFISSIVKLPTLIKNIKPNSIRIAGCWPLDNTYIYDFMRVNWFFCGGFFIGYRDILLEFERLVKLELKHLLECDKRLIFEVNIWFRLWRKGFHNLDWYHADHNSSMFKI